ncbi:phage integrase central domain-containing protein [Nitrosospira multiformis]|uniref:phage integrase central domain-containing protein n=1 Tax=Nitrosospira multiformis TaxID=1231 RepID=UPI002109C1F7|nr:hypothetical protein [Nitrosospira multiformis]
MKDWEEVTKARRLNMPTRVVFPKNGSLPVKSIAPSHILDVLNTSAKKNGLTVAAEAKRTMSGVFELAVSTLRVDSDPVYAVRKVLPANKTQHKRPLDSAEIGQLLRDVEEYGGRHETIAAFRLMWLTPAGRLKSSRPNGPNSILMRRFGASLPRDEKAEGTHDPPPYASGPNIAEVARYHRLLLPSVSPP